MEDGPLVLLISRKERDIKHGREGKHRRNGNKFIERKFIERENIEKEGREKGLERKEREGRQKKDFFSFSFLSFSFFLHGTEDLHPPFSSTK